MTENTQPRPLSVIVIGAGIGGLVCAIACRREGLDVQVLEQAAEIKPVSLRPFLLSLCRLPSPCHAPCSRHKLAHCVADPGGPIGQVGAGIQIPPNASRVLARLGLLERVRKEANEVKTIKPRRYADGKLLGERPVGSADAPWM